MINKKTFLYLFACLSLVAVMPAHATCNNPNNWLEAPGKDTKVFANYEPSLRGQFKWATGIPYVSPDVNGHVNPYPIPLRADMLDKPLSRLVPDAGDTVRYFEHDGKGEWRICREDQWFLEPETDDKTKMALAHSITKQYIAANQTLKDIPDGFWLAKSKQYFYDAGGRLVREREWYYGDKKKSPTDTRCYRIDNNGRVILSLTPDVTKTCTDGEPDWRDTWTRYTFGEVNGEPMMLLEERHGGKEDGSWRKRFDRVSSAVLPEDRSGFAEADSYKGVISIIGSNFGKLDDNAANTVVDEFGSWNGASYFFTKPPVPLAVLKDPNLIYQYERRRRTYVDGPHLTLFEWFKPNEHISRHRYYTLDGLLLRHEQLDEKGRVTRIITINDYRQPRPGPNPDVDDKQLSKNAGITMMGHQIYHRVYERDAKGKFKIVAISWNRERFPVMGLNKFKKTSIEFADIVYGTPHGKEKWKSRGEFQKAFDHSWYAAHVFPDVRKGELQRD